MWVSSLRRSSARRGPCRNGRPSGRPRGCAGSRPGTPGTRTRRNPPAPGSKNPRLFSPGRPPGRASTPGSGTPRPCGDAVKILSDDRYQSDPSHRLLPPLCGPSPEPPDPFDEHRDETATTRRAAEATTRVKSLSGQGRKAHTTDEARPEHEAWTRRMQPPKGQRTRAVREPAEDVPVLPRRPPPDQQNSHAAPDRGEPEHRADDPRTGPAPTRNRDREDRGRPGQRPPPTTRKR